jgi:hypothetical protein
VPRVVGSLLTTATPAEATVSVTSVGVIGTTASATVALLQIFADVRIIGH